MRRNSRTILAMWILGGMLVPAAGGPLSVCSKTSPLLQRAIESLHRGRLGLAERQALKITEQDGPPDLTARAWVIAAAARQRRGDFGAAADAYREFLSSCGSSDLRRYAVRQIRKCESARAHARGVQAPSKRLSVEQLRSLARVSEKLHIASSAHFVIHTRNPALARLLATEAETALERIRLVLLGEQEYPHTVDIHVWADRKQFLTHAADAPEWSGAAFRFSVRNGLATRRIDLTQLDQSGRFDTIMLDRILPHELCHLLLREYLGDATCPLLIDEGLAMLVEWEMDNDRVLLGSAAAEGAAGASLDELLVRQKDEISEPRLFYAAAFSFTEFLHSRLTGEQFRTFLAQVKNGCTVAESLQRALYLPHRKNFLAELHAAWKNHAAAQAQYLRELSGRERPPEPARK